MKDKCLVCGKDMPPHQPAPVGTLMFCSMQCRRIYHPQTKLIRLKVTQHLQLEVPDDTLTSDLDGLLRDLKVSWQDKIKEFDPEELDVDFEWQGAPSHD